MTPFLTATRHNGELRTERVHHAAQPHRSLLGDVSRGNFGRIYTKNGEMRTLYEFKYDSLQISYHVTFPDVTAFFHRQMGKLFKFYCIFVKNFVHKKSIVHRCVLDSALTNENDSHWILKYNHEK